MMGERLHSEMLKDGGLVRGKLIQNNPSRFDEGELSLIWIYFGQIPAKKRDHDAKIAQQVLV